MCLLSEPAILKTIQGRKAKQTMGVSVANNMDTRVVLNELVHKYAEGNHMGSS